LLGEFEPDRAAGLFLADRCSIERVAVGSYVIDANCHDMTASQFAIDGEVEQSEIRLQPGDAATGLRPSSCSLVRIVQTWLARSGGFAPISLPLFQG
jgi:hypothetical protein